MLVAKECKVLLVKLALDLVEAGIVVVAEVGLTIYGRDAQVVLMYGLEIL